MANDYTQGTVTPDVPDIRVPEAELRELVEQEEITELLALNGIAPEEAVADWKVLWRGVDGAWEPTQDGQVYLFFEHACHTALATVLQALLKHCPFDSFQLEYAHTCEKMRPGHFGGGACLVTRQGIHWQDTRDWLEQKVEQLRLVGEILPVAIEPAAGWTYREDVASGACLLYEPGGGQVGEVCSAPVAQVLVRGANDLEVRQVLDADGRALAAILAGLRLLQRHLDAGDVPDGILQILEDGGHEAPSAEAIDDLCQQLNLGGPPGEGTVEHA